MKPPMLGKPGAEVVLGVVMGAFELGTGLLGNEPKILWNG